MKGIAILGATGGLGEAIATRLAKRVPISIGYGRNKDKAAALAASTFAFVWSSFEASVRTPGLLLI